MLNKGKQYYTIGKKIKSCIIRIRGAFKISLPCSLGDNLVCMTQGSSPTNTCKTASNITLTNKAAPVQKVEQFLAAQHIEDDHNFLKLLMSDYESPKGSSFGTIHLYTKLSFSLAPTALL